MKFLVDAQLPRRLARALRTRGRDAVEALFLTQLDALVEALQAARFIELSHEALIVHS